MGKKIETSKKAAAPAAAVTAAAPAAKAVKKLVRKAPSVASARTTAPAISGEDIALRAYFIAETRLYTGLAGDSQSDWLEAERQLLAERSGKKSPASKSKPAAKRDGDSAA